jgi:hypothetical protein
VAKAAPSCASDGEETWETFEELHALGEKTDLLMYGALRTDCGFSRIDLYYKRVQAGFSFQPLKHLQIRPYYYLIVKDPSAKRTHAICLELNANDFSLHRWRIEEKNRIEEDFQPSGNTTRFTDQLELGRPVRVGGLRVEPYAKGYAKYDLRYLGWAYTRVYLGAYKQLPHRMTLDGYYVRQFGSHLEPGTTNAIGLTIHARF